MMLHVLVLIAIMEFVTMESVSVKHSMWEVNFAMSKEIHATWLVFNALVTAVVLIADVSVLHNTVIQGTNVSILLAVVYDVLMVEFCGQNQMTHLVLAVIVAHVLVSGRVETAAPVGSDVKMVALLLVIVQNVIVLIGGLELSASVNTFLQLIS